jgi:molecular chaperone DnaK (HSP70)
MEYFGQRFNKKYGVDCLGRAKLRIRMVEAISKMRKILTSNREASLSIECLVDDEDLFENFNREEFLKVIDPYVQRFQALLHQAIKEATHASKIIY